MPTPGNSPGFRKPKQARAATTTALPAYTLGADGVFTANANGALPAQDGITLVAGDNFLSKNETGGRQPYNWVMQVIDSGSGGTPFKFQRAPGYPLRNGEFVFIGQGSTLQAKIFEITTADPITVNTTALTIEQAGGSSASAATFNVLDYGAKADCTLDSLGNVTGGTDNTAAFQAALNALAAVKDGIIYIPSGKYLFTTGNLTLNAENFIIQGDGDASQIVVDCGGARWISMGTSQRLVVQDLAFLGNSANVTNCSAVFYHSFTIQPIYARLSFYGIGALTNLISYANSSLIARDIFIGGCFIADFATLTNGFIGALLTNFWMDIESFQSQDFGTIDGIGYSRGAGHALCAINLGPTLTGAPPDYGQVGSPTGTMYLLRNLNIDEGAQSAVFGQVNAGGRYLRVEIDGLNMNLNNTVGGVKIQGADNVVIRNAIWGLHPGQAYVFADFTDAGNVAIENCHAVPGHLIRIDSATKSLRIVSTVYSGILFTGAAPRVTEEIDGIEYTILPTVSAVGANLLVVPAASGKIDLASTAKVSGDIRGITVQAAAFSVGSITAIPKASLHSGSYFDMPTVDGQAMRIELDNGAPINPAEVHYDYSGIGATAINVATGLVAAFNAFGARKYDASNVGGTSAVITFTARALGSQYDGLIGGNLFLFGDDWHKVDPVGGFANIRVLDRPGQIASLKTDANYAIGDYILPSNANAGQGLKAASGNFCALVVAPTSGGLTPVILGKFTA